MDTTDSHRQFQGSSVISLALVMTGILCTAVIGGAVGAGGGNWGVALPLMWAVWLPIAIICGTRSLWDKRFAAGGSRLHRLRALIGSWYGWTGLATTAVLGAAWMLFGRYGIHPRGGLWLIPEIGIPVVLLLFRGIPRRIGAGLAVTLLIPTWPFLLVGAIVVLGPPALIYVLAVGISRLIGLGSRRSDG